MSMNEKLSDYLINSSSNTTPTSMDMLNSTSENCTVDSKFSISNEGSILSNQSEELTTFSFPMSIPNPKRSVPVNFLHIINEESYDLDPTDYNFSASQSVQNNSENYSFTKVNDIHSSLNTISHNKVGQIKPFPGHQWDAVNSNSQNDMEFNSNCNVINRKIVGTIGRPKSTPIHLSGQRFEGGLFNSNTEPRRPSLSVTNLNGTGNIYEDYPYRDNTTLYHSNDDNNSILGSNNAGRTYFNQQNMYLNNLPNSNSIHSKDSLLQPQYINGKNEIVYRSNINGNPNSYHNINNELMGTILRVHGGTASAPPLRHYKESIHMLDTTSVQKDHNSICKIANVEQGSIEDTVLRTCREILFEAAGNSLKAVELANTLRARVGVEILAQIREKWGGLLSLLERASNIIGEYEPQFRVDRIPKSDQVTLITPVLALKQNNCPISNNSSSNISNQDTLSRTYYENNEHEFHSNFQTSTATRCLHVGNVPSNLSEIQLMQEFEKFGQLDGLKLVLQRNGSRRFAFVTFRTIEQAITAKHCLSKQHPWKSVIAFARKEFSHQHKVNHNIYAYHNNVINSNTYKDGIRQNEYNIPLSDLEMQQPNNSYGYLSATTTLQNNIASPYTLSTSSHPLNKQTAHCSYVMMDNATGGGSSSFINHALQQRSCKVLQRLCDDTYVPTQPWPIDIEKDLGYCQAVIAQLQQFGGYCTISKLRGFLRHRIAAVDNIKSVPLKAMLSAYPQYFVLESNHISLVNHFPYSSRC